MKFIKEGKNAQTKGVIKRFLQLVKRDVCLHQVIIDSKSSNQYESLTTYIMCI